MTGTNTARVHLELLSKQQLIQRAREAQKAAEHWHRKYALERYASYVASRVYREPTPESVLADAEMLLGQIGMDPNAARHRDDLLAALDDPSVPTKCWRMNCDELLSDGHCPKHDWRLRQKKAA